MAPIVKLLQGKDTLDLNSGRYCIEDSDFLPPTTAREVTFGRAAVGQNLASKRRANRSWGFSVNIDAASISEAERALRDLQAFLNRAGENRSEPLFVAYRAWNDHTFEPFFGQFGALARYEIVSANAELASEYLNPLANSNRVVRVAVDLVIKPQALGIPQRAGQAKGRVYEDFLGTPDGLPRGTWVEDSITALEFTNPVFMSTTAYDTGWSVGGTGTEKSQNLDPTYIQVGTRSLKFSSIQTDNSATLHQSVSLVDTNNYWVHCLVKRHDGGAISSSQLGFVFTGTGGNSFYIALKNGWYWCGRKFTATSTASANVGFYWNSAVPAYFDACSVGRNITLHNLLKEAAWGAYDTATTDAYLRYKFDDIFPARNQWTVRIVWKPPPESSGTRYLINSGGANIAIAVNSSNQIFVQTSTSNTTTSSAITVTAGTPVVIHVTYNGDTVTMYENGTSVGSASGKAPMASTSGVVVYVGSSATPSSYSYGTIMGVATYEQVMTATEVSADYTQVAQQAADDQRIDSLPYLWTKDGDDVIDNQQSSTARNFAFISGMIGDDVEAELFAETSGALSVVQGLLFGVVNRAPGLIRSTAFDDEASTRLFAVDGAGTVDATANNGAVERQNVTTSTFEFCDTDEQIIYYPAMRGQEIFGWTVVKDAGSNLQLRLVVHLGSEKLYSDWRRVSVSSSLLGFLLGPVKIPDNPRVIDVSQKLGFAIEAKRTTGSGNLDMSHAMYLPKSTYLPGNQLQTPSNVDGVYIRGREVIVTSSALGGLTQGVGRAPLMSRPIDLRPNQINGILFQLGEDTRSWTNSLTADFDKILVTPRWDIY